LGIVLASCGLGWAGCGSVENTGRDAGADSGHDAGADSGHDAGTDSAMVPDDSGAPAVSYDIAYISKLTFTPDIRAVHQFVVVVNRGSAALPLSTVAVKDVGDDNPGVDWAFTSLVGSAVMLKPGRAAGRVSPAAKDELDTVVTEPLDDQLLDFEMRFPSPPPVGLVLLGQVVITISGVDATLVFTVQVTDTGDLVLENPKRIGAQL